MNNITKLTTLKNNHNRLIAIDFGEKNIGIALSDLTWTIATPTHVLKNISHAENLKFFTQYLMKNNIVGIVVGYPKNMDGSHGFAIDRVERFIEKSLPQAYEIIRWDERYSSMAVERAMLSFDLSRKKRSAKIDKAAAAYILQGFLEFIDNKPLYTNSDSSESMA